MNVAQDRAEYLTEAFLVNLHKLLEGQSWEQDECVICLDPLGDEGAQLTPCGHLFGKTCLRNMMSADINRQDRCVCPVCRKEVQAAQLLDLADFAVGEEEILKEEKEAEIEEAEMKGPDAPRFGEQDFGTKLNRLVLHLMELPSASKGIVFSQWQLDFVSAPRW